MIKIKNFILEPTGSGRYDMYQMKKPAEPKTEKQKKNHDPKRKIKSLIGYDMHLSGAINRMNHIINGEVAKEKDISLSDYIRQLAATKVNIEKLIKSEIQKNK